MNFLHAMFDKYRPLFEPEGSLHWAWPMFEGAETFVFTPTTRTERGTHVRDAMDMKRLMIFVVYALVPCILFGWHNVGAQAYAAEGVASSVVDNIVRGGWAMLPVIIMSYTAGGIAELLFCVVRKHEINEGFLVTAMLFPLTLPPSIPLWMVAAGIVFGVIIGKEVFGGVGMNFLNPALTARAFVFFTWPAYISGAKVWDIADSTALVDGYTGATPLLAVASRSEEVDRGLQAIDLLNAEGWSWMDMFIGTVPGSMGEVSALACLLGAIWLIITGIASWRIMVGCVIGLVAITGLFNGLASETSFALWTLPPHYHLVMGGFAFGTVFMATDPVSSASTIKGKWIYGIAIGGLCGLIRVVNPAYPEGMMLAILFMNVFAPLIDYYVIRGTTKRRQARMAAA